MFGLIWGAFGSNTLWGPPERISPFTLTCFCHSSILAGEMSGKTISEYTLFSLVRLSIRWLYCPPKSRTRIVSGFMLIPVCCCYLSEGGVDYVICCSSRLFMCVLLTLGILSTELFSEKRGDVFGYYA